MRFELRQIGMTSGEKSGAWAVTLRYGGGEGIEHVLGICGPITVPIKLSQAMQRSWSAVSRVLQVLHGRGSARYWRIPAG